MIHWLEILSSYGLPAPLVDYSPSGSLDRRLTFNETMSALRVATNKSEFAHYLKTGKVGVSEDMYIMRHHLTIDFMTYNIMKKHC